MSMLAAPAAVAVKVAAARAALMAAAVPLSWMPGVEVSASVRPLTVPLLATSVTVSVTFSPSTSATVKSARAAAVPVVTACALVGTPLMVGASFTAVTVTVVLPTTSLAPPAP